MEETKDGAAAGPVQPATRQPYEKPAIAWEEGLEVRPNLMAGCGKISGQDAACDAAPGS